jgi:2,4-dienoyl-CoA reductase-like NADH-dependent reductase (Old Yellow Enzyme family)
MATDATAPWPHLFSPLRVGPVTLAHRAIMSAHGMGLGAGGPGVSERYHAYLVERARGGAAMIGMESAPVHPSTFSRSLVIRLYEDGCIPSLARLADAVHAAGSRLSITLWHGGHKDGALRGPYSLAPSPVPNMSGEVPKAMTRREIREVVAAYGSAAARCRAAGLDCLEVQTATDYLLGSFLSPALNHRGDEYGGSAANRARIVRQVLEAVREAAGPGITVGVRTSARHDIPGAPVDYTLEVAIESMASLAAAGLVDYVSVMAGSGWAEGVSIPALHHPRACLAAEARRFREAVRVPVFVAGRVRDADEAEALLARGDADVVAMARTWIAEPDWARKLREGRAAEVRPCMSCNQGCVGSVFRGMPGTCVLNPRAGRELDWPSPAARPPALRPTVAVIGGGPAGLETARLAAERGHAVTLYEALGQLGGQWRLAAATPQRAELGLPLRWWESELRRLGVTVRLGERVEPASPPAADRVVWAVGSSPAQTAVWRLRPYLFDGLPGAAQALHGRDVMAGRAAVAGRVAMLDEEGGWPAISLLAWLLAAPAVETVTVFTTEASFGEATVAISFEGAALRPIRVAEAAGRVRFVLKSRVQAIEDSSIIQSDGSASGPFDAILLSTGTAANAYPEEATAVGDCIAPRGLWSATSDAARLVSGWAD